MLQKPTLDGKVELFFSILSAREGEIPGAGGNLLWFTRMLDKKIGYGYIRVSGEEQLKGFGLEFQEQDIRAFATKNNVTIKKIARDEGISGSTADRPGLKEVIQDAKGKKFEVLIVWKLDRLFRDTKLTLQTLDELTSYGVEFRSVNETFTHDSSGRFLLTLMASVAEMERKNIAQRMIAGRIISAKRGTWICGGTPPYGYRYNETTKRLEILEDEARVVRMFFNWLVKDKLTTYAIQNRVNGMGLPTKWSAAKKPKAVNDPCWWQRTTILRILKNEVYTGTTYIHKWKKIGHAHNEGNLRPQEDWIQYTCPAIISRELYDQAQAQIERNKLLAPRRTKRLYLFAKKIVCGKCGRRYFAALNPARSANAKGTKYYTCAGIRAYVTGVRCSARQVAESRIEKPLMREMVRFFTDPKYMDKALGFFRDRNRKSNKSRQRIAEIQAEIISWEEKQERATYAFAQGGMTYEIYNGILKRFKGQIERLRSEQSVIEGQILREDLIKQHVRSGHALFRELRQRLLNGPELDYETKRIMFSRLVENVTITADKLSVTLNIPKETEAYGLWAEDRADPKPMKPKPFSYDLRTNGFIDQFSNHASEADLKVVLYTALEPVRGSREIYFAA